MAGFGDQTTAADAQNTMHFCERELAFAEHGEETGGDERIEMRFVIWNIEGVDPLEAAIAQTSRQGAPPSPGQLTIGPIDANDRDLSEPPGETAGIKSWAASKLDQFCSGNWRSGWPKGVADSFRVIAE